MNEVVRPLDAPPNAQVRVPGSKSITNRALVAAALADGTSVLRGVLHADDSEAMVGAIRGLGASVEVDGDTATIRGVAGRPAPAPAWRVDAHDAATVARFMLAVAACVPGEHLVDGAAQLRGRPMGPLVDALRTLGARVEEQGPAGRLPVRVTGPIQGGKVELSGDVSSQFTSALMLVAPLLRGGIRIDFTTPLVSRPYVQMTAAVMAAFGCAATVDEEAVVVPEGRYVAARYDVEPDASSASYFYAAAAVTGGSVAVEGLGAGSLQGDLAFVDLLERMGAVVDRTGPVVRVSGAPMRGVDVELSSISDTAPTLAAVAPFASSPTRARGIGFIRSKETDRIGLIVQELRRLGVDASEEIDGFVVNPGLPRAGVVDAHGDHRLAMAFAVIGLRVRGIEIAGAECVTKTFPGFFTALDQLR